jgi:hypothetical protein
MKDAVIVATLNAISLFVVIACLSFVLDLIDQVNR